MKSLKALIIIWLFTFLFSCAKKQEIPARFVVKSAIETGINFTNTLKPTNELNIFNYMYFYNGAGVAAGDLNNDGQPDLVFTANQSANKIYLNKGALKFEDISNTSDLKTGKGWSTGVSLVDINQDGKLDIYISQVGKFERLNAHNLLYVCTLIDKNGIPHYEEQSKNFGLDLVGFGTQAAFFDYDLDNDLDMYQLNHSVHANGTYGKREQFENTFHPLAGDRFFENINGKYVEKTKQIGINSSAIGYGLGITVGDINLDGYPDIYIGNDFHENDYLYINKNGKNYIDELHSRVDHTSRFTMGVDIADLNNDIFPEIFSLDMLPNKPEILKRSEGEDVYYNFKFKASQGYDTQFARNNLQLNNGAGYFSEIGMYSGVHATDWSWAALLFDFENDGKKDIFIANGINKRMNDLDYINFVGTDEIQKKIADKNFDESDKSLSDLLPEIKIPNRFFSNGVDLAFNDIAEAIQNNGPSYSNGAVYADFDADGDLDLFTNNINQEAFLYENKSAQQNPENKTLTISLTGPEKNKNAIGAKCIIFTDKGKIYQEKQAVKGFLSSMESPMFFGLGKQPKVDSILLIWPDNTFQTIDYEANKKTINLKYTKNLPLFNYKLLEPTKAIFKDIATEIGLDIQHKENQYNEFDREALIPNMMSTEGPAIAVADVNGDGLDDLYLGASKWEKGQVFIQNKFGKFVKTKQESIDADSTFEDIDAQLVDINNDKWPDLVVASGGNEFYGKSPNLAPRAYLNDGKGNFTKKTDAFEGLFLTASSIKSADYNGDGFQDLFIGARTVSWAYGQIPESYLLQNDGTGKFKNNTEQVAKDLTKVGFVKNANWVDFDNDKDLDLIIALEWDGIFAFKNEKGKFTKEILTDKKGWWNMAEPIDIDNDGDLDFVCGNLGLNSRLHASEGEPVRMYVNDFDDNGRLDQIITYYLEGKETIFADKREIEKQLPFVKKEFIYAKDFAKASLGDLFGKGKIADAQVFEANYFENSILINEGRQGFKLVPMQGNAQMATYRTAQKLEINGDKRPDLMLLGNFYECNIQMGLYDADHGNVYLGIGENKFAKKSLLDNPILGQFRNLKKIIIGGKEATIAVRNNDKLMVLIRKN